MVKIIALLLFVGLQFVHVVLAGNWTLDCPRDCTCYLAPVSSLPFAKWIDDISLINDTEAQLSYQYHNELILDDEWQAMRGSAQDRILKMAMCVIHQGPDPLFMLNLIPEDVEAISILQPPGSGTVTFSNNDFQHFQNLISLEILGYQSPKQQRKNIILSINDLPLSEKGNTEDETHITIEEGTFKKLTKLQFLNLQHISFEKVNITNKRSKRSAENSYFVHNVNIPNSKMVHEIVFISPDEEIIPYEIYKDEKLQEKENRSHIFSNMTSLRFLRVHACSVDELNWEMFEGLWNLEFLSLDYNKLRFIPDFVFYGVPNLMTLSMSHNEILNIESSALAGLLNLRKLHFTHNKLNHLSELSLPPFPKLELADFQGNPISAIFPSTFEIMNTTKVLYLGSKKAPLEFYSASFLGLDQLESLTITNAIVDILERDMLKGMPMLRELFLHGNIKIISWDAFLEVSNLETLVLSKCQLDRISMDSFVGLPNLHKLDLSYNEIDNIPPGVFDGLLSLRELWLQNNNLTTLPRGLLKHLPTKLIRLQRNPWHCSCIFSDWNPTVINKIKQHIGKQTFCQFHPITNIPVCVNRSEYQYNYSKRVAPTCQTPKKFRHVSVFDVMRRELRCSRNHKKADENRVPKNLETYEKHTEGNKIQLTVEHNKEIENKVPKNLEIKGKSTNENIELTVGHKITIETKQQVEEMDNQEKQRKHKKEKKQKQSDEKSETKHHNKKFKIPPISKKALKLEQERRRIQKQKN